MDCRRRDRRIWNNFTRNKPKDYVLTAAEVNAAQSSMMGHDDINRWILTRTRIKRLGLPLRCDLCNGDGTVYTSPDAHVTLMLWMLVPRKGCSRGVEINNITQDDLSEVFTFLKDAADRNAARFSGIKKP